MGVREAGGNRYSPFKLFRYPDRVKGLPRHSDTIAGPVHVRIKPTNRCNHNCWYCAYKSEDLSLGEEMNQRDEIPREKILEIIDDLSELGTEAVTSSGGGEPFAYPHLLEALQALVDRGLSFAALTNGALVKGEVASFFAQHGTWLRVSLDAWDGASYAKSRSVKEGEYGKVLENMARFQAFGGTCSLGVSFIVTRDNQYHLEEATERLIETGVESIKFSPCIVSGVGRENLEHHEPIFETVREKIESIIADKASHGVEIYDAYHLLDDKFDKDYTWCPMQQLLTVIAADQQVYTCQDKAYTQSGTLGSLKETRFKNLWLKEKSRFFKVDPSRDCDHHCVSNAKNRMLLDFLDLNENRAVFV